MRRDTAGRMMIALWQCLLALLVLAGFGSLCVPAAGQPSYPLYCQGPLTTSTPTPPPTGPTTTPFLWASTGAGAQEPGPGQCAWADRPAGGDEVQAGNGNVICDDLGVMASVPAGQFWEVGVYRDPASNNCMRATRYVGTVTPPFSAVPALPPTVTPPSYSLYCQGPLVTAAPTSTGGPSLTPYMWAATGAGAQSPGTGQCAWADRAAGGLEIQSANGNSICDWSGQISGVPAGQFFEIGVYRDESQNNCMHVTRIIGTVSEPFSAVPALPPYVRPSVGTLSVQQIASLRNGIHVMMSRNALDPTSFRFQANIHGTHDAITNARELSAWNQCQHGSYYFFSWHRMYLYFFERILRAASGDPNLALPYWNWSDPNQRALPQIFRQPGDALYIPPPGRQTGVDDGTFLLADGTVDFSNAFLDTSFDSMTGSGMSFGGQIVMSPMQFHSPHGELESQPHDAVHVALGGLMGDADQAAQDPIFWLHHANVDRLWNRWIAQGDGRADPTDAAWLNTTFTFFDENGTAVNMTGQQVVDTAAQLGYRYDDDVIPPGHHRMMSERVAQSPTSGGPPHEMRNRIVLSEVSNQASRRVLDEHELKETVPLAKTATKILESELKRDRSRRVVLLVNGIEYERVPGVIYELYLDAPAGATKSWKGPYFAGNLSFFALKPHHGMAEGKGGAARDFDVTKIVDRLLREHQWDSSHFVVTFVPATGLVDKKGRPVPVTPGKKASFGGIVLSLE